MNISNTSYASYTSTSPVLNMHDLYFAIVFSFLYVISTIGVITIIILYQEELDNVQNLSLTQLSDINVQKIMGMYAKFVFCVFFFAIFYRLIYLTRNT